VAGGVDGTADGTSGVLLWVADRPELLEGLSSINGRLVDAGGLQDVIGSTVASHGSLPAGSRAGVVRAVGLDDVVLDEWVASPSVDSEVAVTVGLVCARVVDDTAMPSIKESIIKSFSAYRPL